MGCIKGVAGMERKLEEKDLNEKQIKWLEESRRIGKGPMTKTERQTLEGLYNEMTPEEREQLGAYIEEKFGYEIDEGPILAQKDKEYTPPSDKLSEKIGKAPTPKPPLVDSDKE
jgi:hypothetical protein